MISVWKLWHKVWQNEYVETAPMPLYFDAEGNVGLLNEVLS